MRLISALSTHRPPLFFQLIPMLHSIKPIIDRKIRIAIVGCGRISINHIRSIALHSDRAELVALCDINPERMNSALDNIRDSFQQSGIDCNPKLIPDYSDLLAQVDSGDLLVDLVVLTTPSGLHPSQAILAASSGLHVCTEKPMATRWDLSLIHI